MHLLQSYHIKGWGSNRPNRIAKSTLEIADKSQFVFTNTFANIIGANNGTSRRIARKYFASMRALSPFPSGCGFRKCRSLLVFYTFFVAVYFPRAALKSLPVVLFNLCVTVRLSCSLLAFRAKKNIPISISSI